MLSKLFMFSLFIIGITADIKDFFLGLVFPALLMYEKKRHHFNASCCKQCAYIALGQSNPSCY